MSYPVFYVPAGDVLPVPFSSYAGATGASVTLTGLAVTDIEIYKDGSTTQRASDAGYTLLDTDGIDFDGITGIHGFSIDTGDNTDAGFYTVGAWFTVIVSAVTIDSQTVNFVACQFRIMAGEGVAGVPDVNTTHVSDTAQTAGDLKGTLTSMSGATFDTSTDSLEALRNRGDAAWTTATGFSTLDAAGVRTAVGLASANLDTQLDALPTAVENADALLGRNIAGGSSSGRTVKQALYFLRNRWTAAAGTLTVYETDDSTASWTGTLSSSASADPITGNDPA